jgi:hypothetical protein
VQIDKYNVIELNIEEKKNTEGGIWMFLLWAALIALVVVVMDSTIKSN